MTEEPKPVADPVADLEPPLFVAKLLSKVCFHCKRELPVSSFSKSAKSRSGLQSWCKECSNAQRHDNTWQPSFLQLMGVVEVVRDAVEGLPLKDAADVLYSVAKDIDEALKARKAGGRG